MGKQKVKKPEIPEEEVYYVEVVKAARVVSIDSSDDEQIGGIKPNKKGKKRQFRDKRREQPVDWEYLVKWAGYGSEADSWEPSRNLKSCGRLLKSLWENIGEDDRDYEIGEVVRPSKSWIKKERARFVREHKIEIPGSADENNKESKNEISYEKLRSTLSESSLNGKQKKRKIVESDDSDGSDKPLIITTATRKGKKRKRDNYDVATHRTGSEPKIPKLVAETISSEFDKGNEAMESNVAPLSAHGTPTSSTSLFSEPSPPRLPSISTPAPLPPLPVRSANPSLPKRQARAPLNPHTQIATTPQLTASGIGISTKQRIAQGALAPVLPKDISSSKIKNLVPTIKASFPSSSNFSIGFKKNVPTPSIPSSNGFIFTAREEPTLASLNAMPESPTFVSGLHNDIPSASSPTVYPSEIQDSHHYDPFQDQAGSSVPVPDPMIMQAESFLQQIMPPQLSAPLQPTPTLKSGPVPPLSLHAKPAIPVRIPKKWKWTGSLVVGAAKGTKGNLPFDIRIEDSTDAKSTGFRFSVALAQADTLSIHAFHDVAETRSIFPACRFPSDLARVALQPDQDEKSWLTFIRYMIKFRKFALSPIYMDQNLVAHILLYSSILSELNDMFKVPITLRSSGSLLAALIPWTLSQSQISQEAFHHAVQSLESAGNPKLSANGHIRTSLAKLTKIQPAYSHALNILGFPEKLHEFLDSGKKYHDWAMWREVDTSPREGLETSLLLAILKQTAAKQEMKKPRVIFAHVGSLKTLHLLPGYRGFVNTPFVQFYTYGTHESVSPRLWGIKEIYPCGGVVTVSPLAVSTDPLGVVKKVKQIREHPFWACYILPSVLGMLAKEGCGDNDPLVLFDRGKFPYDYILRAIEAGELSLIQAPPEDKLCFGLGDHRQAWVQDYLTLTPYSARDALTRGVNAFNSVMANVPRFEWQTKIEAEISKDLASMQQQPSIMTEYRRYVVLTGRNPTDKELEKPTSLEWLLPIQFSFKDEFSVDFQTRRELAKNNKT